MSTKLKSDHRRKKYTAVLAIACSVMVSTLSGCGSSNSPTASTAASSPETVATSAPVSTTATKEPITLKIYSAQSFPGNSPSGVQLDEVSKEIERVTGVKLEWDMQPTEDKTKIMIASGDMPDIFIANNTEFISNLVKAEAVLPLDDLIKSNGPDVAKTAATSIAYSKQYLSNNTDKTYFVPGRVLASDTMYAPAAMLNMRWDYYKELNYPEIKSDDDLVKVLSDMQKKHPTTPDGKKVYGFSMWQDWGNWHYSVLNDNLFALMPTSSTSPIIEYDGLTYEVKDGTKDDSISLWKDAKLYNKAYRAGLIDPDSFTQKYDQATAKMNGGQVLAQVASWLTGPPNAEFVKQGKETQGFVSIPWTGSRVLAGHKNPIGLASYWSISKKTKYPDRAMEVMNYFFSEDGVRTIHNGVKDTYWTTENGKAKLTEAALNAIKDPSFITTTGIGKFSNLTGFDGAAKDSNGQFYNLFNEPEVIVNTLTPLQKDWLTHYNVTTPDEFWHKNGGVIDNTAFAALMPQAGSDVKRIGAKLDSYLVANLPKLVMSKDDAAFESMKKKMIEDILKLQDYKKLSDFYMDAITKTKEAVKSFQ